jgi:ribosomal-protein-serine acetyltransferase
MQPDLLIDFEIEPSAKRYELRLLQKADAAVMFALTDANRSYLREWLPWLDTIEGVNDTQNFIQHTLQQAADRQGFVAAIWEMGGIESMQENRLVGVIGLNKIDWQNRIGYIGYWLSESDRGRGIMTIACKVLVDYAFSTLQLDRLVIACAVENQPSRAIPIRLGFRHEGVARAVEWLYDRLVDHDIYVLLQREWQSQNNV